MLDRLVFQFPGSMSVGDAPRLVSSDASPPVPEWAVTRTTWSSGAGLVAAGSVQIARATLSFTAQGAHLVGRARGRPGQTRRRGRGR